MTRSEGADRSRYGGGARWRDDESRWNCPTLDHQTWPALGHGRRVSRRLPEGAIAEAGIFVKRVLEGAGAGTWVAAGGRRGWIVGQVVRGGLRKELVDGVHVGRIERRRTVEAVRSGNAHMPAVRGRVVPVDLVRHTRSGPL